MTVAGRTVDFARRGVIELTILGLAATGGALLGAAHWLNKAAPR